MHLNCYGNSLVQRTRTRVGVDSPQQPHIGRTLLILFALQVIPVS